jgi:hypothetical protein
MSRILALSLFVIMSTSAPSAIAQDAPDEDAWKALVAYTALISTPAGMLDPTVPEVDARPAGPRFILRYGRLGEPLSGESARLQSVGLHASVPAGRARVEASAGRLFWCEQVERGQVEFERVEDACSGSWAAGLAVAVTVWRVSLDGGPGSLSVGLRPAVGLKLFPEADDDLRALSADVTAPIAVSLGSATKAVFYAAPRRGLGTAAFDEGRLRPRGERLSRAPRVRRRRHRPVGRGRDRRRPEGVLPIRIDAVRRRPHLAPRSEVTIVSGGSRCARSDQVVRP